MTDSFVTQCPHCQTRFRVNHAQLSVARGVVRCGSCLQVFNAARQLLEQRMGEEAQALTPPPAVIPQPEQRAISQKQWTAAELDLDHLDLDQELARLEQREIQPTQAFGQPRKPREESLSASRDSGESDEPWSDSLFSQPADERVLTDDTPPKPDTPLLGDIDDLEPTSRTEPSLSLVDLDDEPDAPQLRLDAVDEDLPSEPRHERLSASADDDFDEQPEAVEPVRKKRARNEPAVREEVLQDLVDDPLQLVWQ